MKLHNLTMRVLSILAFIFLASSCVDKNSTKPNDKKSPVIVLESTSADISRTGGALTIPYTIENPVNGKKLEATSDKDWLKVASVSDNAIQCEITQNTTNSDRTVALELNYPGAVKKSFTVNQSGAVKNPGLSLTFNAYNQCSTSEGSAYFEVELSHTVDGAVMEASSDSDWLVVTDIIDNKKILFSYSENPDYFDREGMITVTYGNAKPLKVSFFQYGQRPCDFMMDDDATTISNQKQELILRCTITKPLYGEEMEIINPDNEKDPNSWFKFVKIERDQPFGDNFTITYQIEQNNTYRSRSFSFTCRYKDAEDYTITVTQEAKPLENVELTLDNDFFTLDKIGGKLYIPFSITNQPEEIESISVIADFGNGNKWFNGSYDKETGKILIRARVNDTGAVREAKATIEVYFKDWQTENWPVPSKDITLRQGYEDLPMKINPTSAVVDYKEDAVWMDVELAENAYGAYNTQYRAQISTTAEWVRWVDFNTSNNKLRLGYDENGTCDSRTAEITISITNHAPVTFTLTQKGNPAVPKGAINLGVYGGLYIAVANIGAQSPTDIGNRYAWGEVSTKSSYTWSNYKWGKENAQTKYTGYAPELSSDDDIATKTLGKGWRMITEYEWIHILEVCTLTRTTMNGVKGFKVTSKLNNNSVFIPSCGYQDGTSIKFKDEVFNWCKTGPSGTAKVNLNNAYSLDEGGAFALSRYVGCPVRAVYDPSLK